MNDEYELLLSKEQINGKPLSECEQFVLGDLKLFVCRDDNGFGFFAKAYSWVSSNLLEDGDDLWLLPSTMVYLAVDVTAHFDGVRHMNLGEDGYMNYPNIESLIKVFQKIREIELEMCTDCDK